MRAKAGVVARTPENGRRLRILYSHRILSKDGQGVHLDAMVAALRAAGHEVLVVGPAAYDRTSLGGESRFLNLLRRWMPAVVMELAELAYSAPAYWRLARAADAFRPDVIYERYNLFYVAGALLARRRGLPLLVEVNAPLADERARFNNLRLRRLARWSEAFVWRAASHVLPVTEVLAEHVAAAGVSPERIVVVPNGIDPEEFPEPPIDPPPAAKKQELVLGFVGFVRPWHGVDAVVRAIAAWRGLPRLSLVVVGEGSARPELERLAAELGVTERVRFTGLAERHAIPGLIGDFDIALQPAAVPYASPLKVLEYMAAGRAIVAPDQPNLRELLEDGRTALLFDPARQPAGEAMWEAVLRLVQDSALRARLGAAAQAEIVARDMTWAGNARRIVDLAKTEIAQRAARSRSAARTSMTGGEQ
ncbi:glycosyltransferase family 4 protein [Phenylobacterium sp. LjRoot219]|uniref:glycosyltransferase family 4 protein n=1 Tax=Phenylobacterium sp. LjRoot219 TaxID=3342283 RepID=UPI003F501DE0